MGLSKAVFLYCGKRAASGSVSQWKPFWIKYLGTAVFLAQSHECFLQGAHVQNCLTERGENVRDYSS